MRDTHDDVHMRMFLGARESPGLVHSVSDECPSYSARSQHFADFVHPVIRTVISTFTWLPVSVWSVIVLV